MQKVKIFKTVEREVSGLEDEVNRWIQESGAKIISITGNIAPQSTAGQAKPAGLGGSQFASSDVLLVIVYETEGS